MRILLGKIRIKNKDDSSKIVNTNPTATDATFEGRSLVFKCPTCKGTNRIALSDIKPMIGVFVLCETCKNVSHVPSEYSTTPKPTGLEITGSLPVSISKFGDWYFSHPLIDVLIKAGQSNLLADYGLWAFCANCYHQYEKTVLPSFPIMHGVGSGLYLTRTAESTQDMNALLSGHCPSCSHDILLVIVAKIPEYVRNAIGNVKG